VLVRPRFGSRRPAGLLGSEVPTQKYQIGAAATIVPQTRMAMQIGGSSRGLAQCLGHGPSWLA